MQLLRLVFSAICVCDEAVYTTRKEDGFNRVCVVPVCVCVSAHPPSDIDARRLHCVLFAPASFTDFPYACDGRTAESSSGLSRYNVARRGAHFRCLLHAAPFSAAAVTRSARWLFPRVSLCERSAGVVGSMSRGVSLVLVGGFSKLYV